jgi:hypothetical protein
LVLAPLLLLFLPMSSLAQTPEGRKTAEAAMFKADRDFNQAMAEHDLKRFLSFVAPDAAFDSAEGRGRDAKAGRRRSTPGPRHHNLGLGGWGLELGA